jgi:hypothetical protein
VAQTGLVVPAALARAAKSRTLTWTFRRERAKGIKPSMTTGLAANVMVAERLAVGRGIVAEPSVSLVGAYEVMMQRARHQSVGQIPLQVCVTWGGICTCWCQLGRLRPTVS